MGTVGFTTGTHFWSVEIVDDVNFSHYIMIGVSDNLVLTESNAPGLKRIGGSTADDEIGVGYCGNGYRYYGGTCFPFGPIFKKGDVIGTLLNLNEKTVTFYKNGIRVGTAANPGSLTGIKYYPCVAICRCGQEIRCVGYK